MATGLNGMQIKTVKHVNGKHGDHNLLSRLLNIKPAKLSTAMHQMFASKELYSKSNVLQNILAGVKGSDEIITSKTYEWELEGARRKPLVCLEKVTTDTKPGLGGRRSFEIKLDEGFWNESTMINPQNPNHVVQITAAPRRSGSGWIYEVVLVTEDASEFFPLEYLVPGQKWVKMASLVGEAADKGGGVELHSTVAFEGYMNHYRKEFDVTDYVGEQVLQIELKDSNGKMQKTWLPFIEAKFFKEWYREIEEWTWRGKRGKHLKQGNGRAVSSAAGIQEQLKYSHREYYSTFTANLVEEYLGDIWFGRVSPNSTERNIKAFTGEYGMKAFHKALSGDLGRSGLVKNIETYTNSVNDPVHKNSLEYGHQFTRYNMVNGGSLELIHNPIYDDPHQNGERDSLTGLPIESQRFTFLDFGGENGSSNVKTVRVKDSYQYQCINGLQSPSGKTAWGASANAKASYQMVLQEQCAVVITDPSNCGELILQRG